MQGWLCQTPHARPSPAADSHSALRLFKAQHLPVLPSSSFFSFLCVSQTSLKVEEPFEYLHTQNISQDGSRSQWIVLENRDPCHHLVTSYRKDFLGEKLNKGSRSHSTAAFLWRTHLFLVFGLVNLLLEELHALEGLLAVRAVDQHVAVGAGEAVLGELHAVPQAARVVEAHLLAHPSVRLDGAHVNVLLGLDHLGACQRRRGHMGTTARALALPQHKLRQHSLQAITYYTQREPFALKIKVCLSRKCNANDSLPYFCALLFSKIRRSFGLVTGQGFIQRKERLLSFINHIVNSLTG